MPPALEAALSELNRAKYELGASSYSCVDENEDGVVDCVVSAHNPSVVVYRRGEGRCASSSPGTGQALNGSLLEEYNRVLMLETRARRLIEGRLAVHSQRR